MVNKLTQAQKEIIRKIIYAVETGGQVYGRQDYKAFIGAGTNTSNEKAITIGAGQWYATQAKELLSRIQQADKKQFRLLDTQGIKKDMNNADWNTYNVPKGSPKAECIVSIISSDVGIKCQDEFMEESIVSSAEFVQQIYGNMTVDAIAECVNIIHLGGDDALKRILSKTAKPYSAKNIKATLDLDPADKSSNNQVGDYKSRQDKVYEMINTYLMPTIAQPAPDTTPSKPSGGNTMTENELRRKVADWLVPYVGITEGSAKHKEILNTYNNSELGSRYKMTVYDAWCATSVSAAFIANGLAGAPGSGKLFQCVECSCPEMINMAQRQGIWVENDAYVPKVGDVILYDWQDSGSGDNQGTSDHVGIVYSVNGKNFRVIEGNKSDTVGYRDMTVNGSNIRGYIAPKYSSFASSSGSNPTPPATQAPNSGSGNVTGNDTNDDSINEDVEWTGIVTADELNVRVWAGTGADLCSFSPIPEGSEVGVCDTVNAFDGTPWYFIKYNGKYGFVSADYVKRKETGQPSAPQQSVTSPEPADEFDASLAGTYVTTTDLNVRTGVGTDKALMTTIPGGFTVMNYGYYTTVSGTKWMYVQFTYKDVTYTGYCSGTYLKKC